MMIQNINKIVGSIIILFFAISCVGKSKLIANLEGKTEIRIAEHFSSNYLRGTVKDSIYEINSLGADKIGNVEYAICQLSQPVYIDSEKKRIFFNEFHKIKNNLFIWKNYKIDAESDTLNKLLQKRKVKLDSCHLKFGVLTKEYEDCISEFGYAIVEAHPKYIIYKINTSNKIISVKDKRVGNIPN